MFRSQTVVGICPLRPLRVTLARSRVVCRRRHRRPLLLSTPTSSLHGLSLTKPDPIQQPSRLYAHSDIPEAKGLFDPANDKDACGVGFLGELSKRPTRRCVEDGLEMLRRMTHRGACGCEENSGTPPTPQPSTRCLAGDGAGILCSIPHEFFSTVMKLDHGIELPEEGDYAVGMVFLPKDQTIREKCRAICMDVATRRGHRLIGWRSVPVNNSNLGNAALNTEPAVEQWFIKPSPDVTLDMEVEVNHQIIPNAIAPGQSLSEIGVDVYSASVGGGGFEGEWHE